MGFGDECSNTGVGTAGGGGVCPGGGCPHPVTSIITPANKILLLYLHMIMSFGIIPYCIYCMPAHVRPLHSCQTNKLSMGTSIVGGSSLVAIQSSVTSRCGYQWVCVFCVQKAYKCDSALIVFYYTTQHDLRQGVSRNKHDGFPKVAEGAPTCVLFVCVPSSLFVELED